jgi:hypothetical protein
MFEQASDYEHPMRVNPVTGGGWIPDEDSTEEQVLLAWRALKAREACFSAGLVGKHSLPLCSIERQDTKKRDALGRAIELFALSPQANGYVTAAHPSFDVYMSGLLAGPLGPDFLAVDSSLAQRYPPTALLGLDKRGSFRTIRQRYLACHRP